MSNTQNVSQVFNEYINSLCTQNVEMIKIRKVTHTITREEALDDLHVFQHIIDNSYSGRDYWMNHGVDFEKIYDNVRSFICDQKSINKNDLFEFLCKQLKNIHDGHFTIMTNGRTSRFYNNYKAYFTDILLEKHKDIYEVLYSKVPEITKGVKFTYEQIKDNLFKTLSPVGKEHYLLGTRSWEEINTMTFNANDSNISLPVHLCRATYYKQEDAGIFKESMIDGIKIVTSSRFWEWDEAKTEKSIKEINELGLLLRNEKVLIWNLLGNGGGNSNYPLNFIKGLNEYAIWKMDCAVLSSPSVKQARGLQLKDIEGIREWIIGSSNERDLNNGIYDGTLIILSNDSVASSGEAAINIAKSVRNCIVVGQNSSGIGVFGDVLSYQLPYSEITMNVPHKIFLGGVEEGVGFEPDFWVDKSDVQGEVITWLKDSTKYQALR